MDGQVDVLAVIDVIVWIRHLIGGSVSTRHISGIFVAVVLPCDGAARRPGFSPTSLGQICEWNTHGQ